MKVLHISRTMGQGGAEKVVFQLCKDINDATHFVASCGGEYVSLLSKLNVCHFNIPDMDNKRLDYLIKTFFILNKIIRNYQIDIVHSHHRMAAFYVRLLQIFNKRIKHVYTAHNVFYGKKSLMRFALNEACIIACGDTVKQNLIEEYRLPENCIRVIYNSIELTSIKSDINLEIEKKKREGSFLVGSIGRITEQKGFDVFVKAISICKKKLPNVIGVIIGDGIDRNAIEKLAEDEGVGDSILFLGYQNDVLSLIKKMEFVVLASRWEGFPLTPIETFSVGKTIIVSDIPNNLEIVKNGVNGLSFKVNNYQDLADKIECLYYRTDYRKKLELAALEEYKFKYDYSRFVSCYRNVYISCL